MHISLHPDNSIISPFRARNPEPGQDGTHQRVYPPSMRTYLGMSAWICCNGRDVLTGSSHVRRAVRGEEDSKVVELVNISETLLRSVVNPDPLLSVEGGDTVKSGVHVTRGDGVDTDAVAGPLGGERTSKLNDSGLGGVVAGLLLRVVDDGSGHGSDEDHGHGVLELNHLLSNGLSNQEGTSDVDVEKTTEHVGGVSLRRNVGAVEKEKEVLSVPSGIAQNGQNIKLTQQYQQS